MPDVFLSYSRQDQELAQIYANAMKHAGLEVWWDQTLKSGETYDEVTETALRTAKAVVVLWSPRSVSSRWVRGEATVADRNGTFLPVMVEPCERPVMFELVQSSDLIGWRGEQDDRRWLQFLEEVRSLANHGAAAGAVPQKAAAALPLPEKPSIAVLPFANLGGDPDQAYFADGLMEEIVTCLTRIRSLFVIASGSTLSFRGKDVTPMEAARRLGVRYVLEGSVRKGGNRVRIAVKLIDATSSTQIWADRYDGTLDEIFELQDSVALAVAGVIEFSVQKAETKRSLARRTEDLRAYDLYLQAVARIRTYRREDVFAALDMLERALALDPAYPAAAALSGSCHVIILRFQWTEDPGLHARKLAESVDVALENGADDPEILATISSVHWASGDFARAAQLAKRATALNPGSSWAQLVRGLASVAMGELDSAAQSFEESMRLDPISPNRNMQIGGMASTRFAQQRFAEAAELAREYAQLAPQPMGFGLCAACYGHLGDTERAADSIAMLRAITPMSFEDLSAMFYLKPEHRELFLQGMRLAEAAPQPG